MDVVQVAPVSAAGVCDVSSVGDRQHREHISNLCLSDGMWGESVEAVPWDFAVSVTTLEHQHKLVSCQAETNDYFCWRLMYLFFVFVFWLVTIIIFMSTTNFGLLFNHTCVSQSSLLDAFYHLFLNKYIKIMTESI